MKIEVIDNQCYLHYSTDGTFGLDIINSEAFYNNDAALTLDYVFRFLGGANED